MRAVVLDCGWADLTQAEIIKRHLNRVSKGMPIGKQFAPLAGDDRIQNVQYPVNGEDPHQEEMPGHAFRKPPLQTENVVNPGWEKMKQREAAPTDAIRIVSPIDHESGVDHAEQNWEVDPVKPADGPQVFAFEMRHQHS